MTTPLLVPVAGSYTVTYNSVAIGVIEDGFNLEFSNRADMITGDNLGDIIQDGIFRGVDGVTVDMTLIEAGKGETAGIQWPLNSTFGFINAVSTVPYVGYTMSSLSLVMVCTLLTGPPGAPNSFTASQCILAEGFPVRQQYANRLRRMPLRLRWLPYTDGSSNVVFFKTT
jgi:hypothetical protein